jgi:hypothetical protein
MRTSNEYNGYRKQEGEGVFYNDKLLFLFALTWYGLYTLQ